MANDYKLGKGKAYIDLLDANDASIEGERYWGNSPEINLGIESESLEHFSSEGGVSEKDAEVLQQITRTLTPTIDNISLDNLALFIVGGKSTISKSSTPVTAEPHTVSPGRFYQLGQDASNPTGARGISAVSVAGDGGTPSYTEGTDYEVDLNLGRLEILEGGTITADTAIEVDYTQDAMDWDQVASSSVAAKTAALRFVANNPRGSNADFYFPKANIRPSGELPLIGTDWMSMGFEIEILKKTGVEAIYIDGRPVSSA